MNLSLDVVSDVEEHDYMIIITVISIMVLLRQANQPTEFFFLEHAGEHPTELYTQIKFSAHYNLTDKNVGKELHFFHEQTVFQKIILTF